ncbi:MAG: Hemin transport protein [Stenotrophomonas acidaminiphila]|nr:MAG: Hemin transport protein [Stenotrophomonas acidaminiphila]
MATLRALPGTLSGISSDAFPAAAQLAALGPVLCLYRTQQGSELAGWQQAVRVEAHTGVDSDGLDERLLFFDAQGRCCWRLCLLPDSDFVAWDRLVASLPAGSDGEVAGLADRLWQRLAGRLLGGQWRACALQLHAVPRPASLPVLAASLSLMSPLGIATAQRIAQAEGADLESGLHARTWNTTTRRATTSCR